MNFDLLVVEQTNKEYLVFVTDSPFGRAEGKASLTLNRSDIESFLLITRSDGLDNTRTLKFPNSKARDIKSFGSELYSNLFSKRILLCFQFCLREVQRRGYVLRIRLNLLSAPKLINLPWEYMYDPDDRYFLGHSNNTTIIRSVSLKLYKKEVNFKENFNVLVMISSPKDQLSLNVETEWQWIQEATLELQKRGVINLTLLSKATYKELKKVLKDGDFHVFHYIGHGGYSQKSNEGTLIFENDNGESVPVEGSHLGTLFYNDTVRLAVLNTCNGARTSITDPFAGVAQSLLIKGRIPTVVGMQFEITDEAAIVFSNTFYSSLLEGKSVTTAMKESRQELYTPENPIEWATPVLYINTDASSSILDEDKSRKVSLSEKLIDYKKISHWLNFRILIYFIISISILLLWIILTFDSKVDQATLDRRFQDLGNGIIRDNKNKLMWMKCSVGQSGSACQIGDAKMLNWYEANEYARKNKFLGYGDWKVPEYDQLASLVYCSNGHKNACGDVAVGDTQYDRPTIVRKYFPNTEPEEYWTSTPAPYDQKTRAGFIFFYSGQGHPAANKQRLFYVRLVRGDK